MFYCLAKLPGIEKNTNRFTCIYFITHTHIHHAPNHHIFSNVEMEPTEREIYLLFRFWKKKQQHFSERRKQIFWACTRDAILRKFKSNSIWFIEKEKMRVSTAMGRGPGNGGDKQQQQIKDNLKNYNHVIKQNNFFRKWSHNRI